MVAEATLIVSSWTGTVLVGCVPAGLGPGTSGVLYPGRSFVCRGCTCVDVHLHSQFIIIHARSELDLML